MKLDLVRDSSKAMPSIEDKAAIRHLRIWHCSYKTLEPISELLNLESLTVAAYPDAALQLVGGLSQLLTSLETCPVLRSAQFVGVPKKEIARFYSATKVVNAGAPEYGAEPFAV